MLLIHEKTPIATWSSINRIFVEEPGMIQVSGSQAYIPNVIYEIDNFSYEGLGLEKVGCKMTKWNLLKTRYFSKEEFDKLVTRSKYYLGKNKETTAVAMYFLGSKSSVNPEELDDPGGGPCLLTLSLSIPKNNKPEVMISGRASEVTVKFHTDLIFIYIILSKLGEELGFVPEDCSVIWSVHRAFQSLIPSLVFWKFHSEYGLNWYAGNRWSDKLYNEMEAINGGKTSNAKSSRRVIKFLNGTTKYDIIRKEELKLWKE